MALVSGRVGNEFDINQFTPVGEVAKRVGVSAGTLKRWLKENKTDATWGRDRRDWVHVKTSDIDILSRYKNSVRT